MSAFDDGGMGNVLAPLRHNLGVRMPPPLQINPGMDNPATQLQTAHAMGQARQRPAGQTASPQAGPGQRGPMAGHLYKSVMLKQAGLSEDEKGDYDKLAEDPHTTPQMLHQLLAMRPKMAYQPQTPQPDQPNHGASIGGATPADVAKGEIQIKQGSGRDGRPVMSQNGMQRWMQAASQNLPKGEKVKQLSGTYTPTLNKAGMDEWNKSNPGVPLPTRSTPVENAGFQVSGIAPPPQQAPQQQPMTVEQKKEADKQTHDAAVLKHQNQVEDRAEQHVKTAETNTAISHVEQVLTDLKSQEKELLAPDKDQSDDRVKRELQSNREQQMTARRQRDTLMTPQQPTQLPAPPKPGHPIDPQSVQHFLTAAGGDKNKARELAKQAGWSF
jgi:hypothetical protein